MLITFSICSAIYTVFYISIIYLNLNINYVENIVSLNLDNTKSQDFSIEEIQEENIEK
jgi:hypothetical protein